MSVTPIQGAKTVSPVRPAAQRPRDDHFAAIFAGYTGAMIAGGQAALADPRDAAANEPTARSERIDGEVSDMRQSELARPSTAEREAAGDDLRFDADALRRQARPKSGDSPTDVSPPKPLQSNSPRPSQGLSTKFETDKTAIESALRLDSAGDANAKSAAPSKSAESMSGRQTPNTPSAPTRESGPTRPIVQPVVANTSNSDSSRADAARIIARILVRDFGGPPGRDPSLQPVAANRGAQTNNQPRSSQTQTGSADKPDTPARADDEASTRRTQFAKLMRNVRLNVGQKQSSATIQMNPPQLGRLRIDVRMTDQRLSVQVETHTPQGRALMTERAGELIDALRAGGIEVEQFEIITAAQREALTMARADLPRDANDTSPQLKRTYRRDDPHRTERDDTRTRDQGLNRGGLSLSA